MQCCRHLKLSQQPLTKTLLWLIFSMVAIVALLLPRAHADSTRVAGSESAVDSTLQSLRLQEIRELADTVRTCYGVPGLTVGFSLDGERQAFGLGVADVESGAPVTEHTVFGIGSLTKAFSSALLAELLPASGLHWNSLLKDFIPGFRMSTTLLTEHVTLTDALAHRTGVTDFLAVLQSGYPIDVDRRLLERRAQYFKPTLDFRTSASYNNHLYALGSSVVEHLRGSSWEQLINSTLFARLNMTSSYFGQWWKNVPKLSKMYSEIARSGNVQMPFEILEYGGPLGPAGFILSSANDMLKWLDFALAKTAATDDAWRHVFTAHVPFRGQGYECSFGLGWVEGRYGDIPFWQHLGSIGGYCSIATLLHHHNVTIFISANKWCGEYADLSNGFNSALQPLARLMAEALLGLPVAMDAQSICAQRTNLSAAAADRTSLPPPDEGDRAGTLPARTQCSVGSGESRFSSPAFGDIMIESNGSSLQWQYGRSRGLLVPSRVHSLPEHRSYTMQFDNLQVPQQMVLTFAEDCDSLWLLEQPEVVFVRQSEASGSAIWRVSVLAVTLSSLFSIMANLYVAQCLLARQ